MPRQWATRLTVTRGTTDELQAATELRQQFTVGNRKKLCDLPRVAERRLWLPTMSLCFKATRSHREGVKTLGLSAKGAKCNSLGHRPRSNPLKVLKR